MVEPRVYILQRLEPRKSADGWREQRKAHRLRPSVAHTSNRGRPRESDAAAGSVRQAALHVARGAAQLGSLRRFCGGHLGLRHHALHVSRVLPSLLTCRVSSCGR